MQRGPRAGARRRTSAKGQSGIQYGTAALSIVAFRGGVHRKAFEGAGLLKAQESVGVWDSEAWGRSLGAEGLLGKRVSGGLHTVTDGLCRFSHRPVRVHHRTHPLHEPPPQLAKKSQQIGEQISEPIFWQNRIPEPWISVPGPKHTFLMVAQSLESCGNPKYLSIFGKKISSNAHRLPICISLCAGWVCGSDLQSSLGLYMVPDQYYGSTRRWSSGMYPILLTCWRGFNSLTNFFLARELAAPDTARGTKGSCNPESTDWRADDEVL